MISLLAVDPGWSGQKFAPTTLARVARVKEIIAASGRDILVCVDGGITRDNIAEVAAAGAGPGRGRQRRLRRQGGRGERPVRAGGRAAPCGELTEGAEG